ncbi:hypothetical protein T11_3527 [Trichinella zimbabwensis]|uniref:Uncharacterized protein n=1 Tax=Trichinella zimbabwensis TaxID=268475 RepID=A0A0V1G9N8_9BILA|nr:hypothetical protein T11_3527 [Trichinella zimbabwensis]
MNGIDQKKSENYNEPGRTLHDSSDMISQHLITRSIIGFH